MAAHITNSLRSWWPLVGRWKCWPSVSILQVTAVNGFASLVYVCICVEVVRAGVCMHSVCRGQGINSNDIP